MFGRDVEVDRREPGAEACEGPHGAENARPCGEGEDGGGEDAAEAEIRRAQRRPRSSLAAPGRARKRARRCAFLTATSRSRSNSEPATRREAGTHRSGPILRPSVSEDGCNATGPGSPILSWRSGVSFRRGKPRQG